MAKERPGGEGSGAAQYEATYLGRAATARPARRGGAVTGQRRRLPPLGRAGGRGGRKGPGRARARR